MKQIESYRTDIQTIKNYNAELAKKIEALAEKPESDLTYEYLERYDPPLLKDIKVANPALYAKLTEAYIEKFKHLIEE